MKKFFVIMCLFLPIVFFQACNKDIATQLNGVWQCDIEQTLSDMPGAEALSSELAAAMFQDMTLRIDAEQKKFTLAVKGKAETSSWKKISEKQGTYTLVLNNQTIQIRIVKSAKGVAMLCLTTPGAGQYQKLFFVKA